MLTNVSAQDKEGYNVWKICNLADVSELDSCVGSLLSVGVSLTDPNNAGQTPFQYLQKPVLNLLETKYGIKAPPDP